MVDSMHPGRPPAVFLMGPTAAGKTDLAVALRERFPFEIISVDSALIYRGMDIGTAKPEPELLARAPHRLIDIRDPAEAYSVGEFYADAMREMREITESGRIPLLVGGTMMYFKALRDGLADLPRANPEVRARLEAEFSELGAEALHRRLASVDPEAARRIHCQNRQRLIRALEVFEVSGQPISSFWQLEPDASEGDSELEAPTGSTPGTAGQSTQWERESFAAMPYNIINLAVAPPDRQELHRRIALRFQLMLDAGFVDEVRALYQRGDLDPMLPAIRCVGYRQAWDYLAGQTDYQTMVERGVAATRQLAKRQLTWLRRWPSLTWLESGDDALLERACGHLSHALGSE